METKNNSENQQLSEIVKEVLEMDDSDLISKVIDKLVSPGKENNNKKVEITRLHQK